MPIKVGENPEGDPNSNKFIAKSGDGQRGIIIAMRKDFRQAIILAQNSSITGDVVWGKFYLIEEEHRDNYPVVIEQVDSIPDDPQWTIVI